MLDACFFTFKLRDSEGKVQCNFEPVCHTKPCLTFVRLKVFDHLSNIQAWQPARHSGYVVLAFATVTLTCYNIRDVNIHVCFSSQKSSLFRNRYFFQTQIPSSWPIRHLQLQEFKKKSVNDFKKNFKHPIKPLCSKYCIYNR